MMVYIGNIGHIYKVEKKSKNCLVPGVQKNDFPDFPEMFTKKKIRKIENRNFSRNRNFSGNRKIRLAS